MTPYRTSAARDAPGDPFVWSRRGLALLAAGMCIRTIVGVLESAFIWAATSSVLVQAKPPGSSSAAIPESDHLLLHEGLQLALAAMMLAALLLLCAAPKTAPGRREFRASAALAIFVLIGRSVCVVLPLSVHPDWAVWSVCSTVSTTMACASVALVLLGCWRLGRAVQPDFPGWLHAALASAVVGEAAMVWSPGWWWDPRSFLVRYGYQAIAATVTAALALAVFLPLRRILRAPLRSVFADDRGVPRLPALSHALGPLAAALGARLALAILVAVSCVPESLGSRLRVSAMLFPFSAAAGAVTTTVLFAGILPLWPASRRAVTTLACSALAQALAAAAFSTLDVFRTLAALDLAGSLLWLVAFDHLLATLLDALVAARIRTMGDLRRAARVVLGAMALSAFLVFFGRVGMRGMERLSVAVTLMGIPMVILLARPVLRAMQNADAEVATAIEREAMALAREREHH